MPLFRRGPVACADDGRVVLEVAVPQDTVKKKSQRVTLALKVIRSYTPSPKALRRVVRPTLIRCPNLTTSKTFLPTLNGQRNSDI